jgi:hypothetical protein
MELKTYKEWLAAGFYVRKGEKAYIPRRTVVEPPLFHSGQVEPLEYDDEEEHAKDADYGFDGW